MLREERRTDEGRGRKAGLDGEREGGREGGQGRAGHGREVRRRTRGSGDWVGNAGDDQRMRCSCATKRRSGGRAGVTCSG